MFKRWFKAWLLAFLRDDFEREFPHLYKKEEKLAKDNLALLRRLQVIENSLRAIHVGGVVDPTGGSWVVIGYKVGDRSFINFYDFANKNVGAIRDFLDRFERAGMSVLVKSPFHLQPKRRGKG